MAKSKLREGGVYTLPDGAEVVATAYPGGGYFLYAPFVWQVFKGTGPAQYDVTPEGQIFTCGGQLTLLRAEDLTDTGRTLEISPIPVELFRSDTTNLWWG